VHIVVHALGVGVVQCLNFHTRQQNSLDQHSEVHEAVIRWQSSGIFVFQRNRVSSVCARTGPRHRGMLSADDKSPWAWAIGRLTSEQFATRELAYKFARATA
jgi:hypothetical protein